MGTSSSPGLKKAVGRRESRIVQAGTLHFYLFVQLIAGTQGLLHRGPVVRSVEVEELHTFPLQPLQGCVQLGAHALRLQRLPIPWVGLGGHFHWQREKE